MDSCDNQSSVAVAIIDDDENVLDAVRLALEDHGWCVQAYATGEAFIADLSHFHADCVILNPYLPGVSGAEVARELAMHRSHIPTIGLTAGPGSTLANEVEKAGARVMLTKPVTFEVLVDHVRAAIGHDGAMHE